MSAAETAAIQVVACNGDLVMVPLHQFAHAYARLREHAAGHGIDLIQQACARHFGVSRTEMRSPRRSATTVRTRHVAMYLARELTEHSLPAIARRFGGRDHTTALHACRKVARLVEADAGMRADIELLRAVLAAGEKAA